MKPVALALLVLSPLLAQAQTVYRCGPDGRVYSQTPCADGKPVTVDDARSTEQRKAAHDVARSDAQQASKLADERHRREDAAKGQRAAGFMTAPAQPASAPASKPKGNTKKTKAKAAPADAPLSPVMIVPAAPPPAKR